MAVSGFPPRRLGRPGSVSARARARVRAGLGGAYDAGPDGPPRVVLLPGINGSALAGATLTGIDGEYDSDGTFSIVSEWINFATLAVLGTGSTLVAALGLTVVFRQRVTDDNGTTVALSAPFGPIEAAPSRPVQVTAPTLTPASPIEGGTLTLGYGTFSGTAPITVLGQLQRFTGGAWADIPGATGPNANATSVVVQAGWIGQPLRLRAVASNAAGSAASVYSAATNAVTVATPGPLIADATFGPISENAPIGAVVGQVVNTGGAVGTWAINAGPFAISTTGVITIATPLDYGTATSHSQTVTATNDTSADTATITITVAEAAMGEAVLHSVVLDGTSQAGRAIQYTFGQVFVEGDLMPADDYSLRRADTLATLPTQLDVMQLWGDGSVKHAHVTVTAQLTAGQRLACEAVRGLAGAAGADLSMATALTGRTLSITITPATGTAWTQNLLAGLTAERWLLGPLCAEARQEFDLPGGNFTGAPSMRVVADITAFANGDVRVFLQIGNDKTLIEGGAPATYAATVTQDGLTQWSIPSQTHQQYSALVREFGTTSAGAALPERPFVMPDVHYMASSGLIDDIDTTLPLAPSVTTNLTNIINSPTYNVLKDRRGMFARMGDAGDATQIGWYMFAQAAWLASGGSLYVAARVMRGQAESTPSLWAHRYWADDVGRWVMPSFAPIFGLVATRTSATGTAWASAQGLPTGQKFSSGTATGGQFPVSADHGHQGPWYFLPWIIEARRFYADGVASHASWSFIDNNARYTGYGTPNYNTGEKLGYGWTPALFRAETQGRSAGHDCRTIVNAAKSLPDAYPDRSAYTDLARGQMAWFSTMRGLQEASLTTSYGAGNWDSLGALSFDSGQSVYQPYRENNPGWQQDFGRKAALDYIRAKLPGHDTTVRTFFNWYMTWHTVGLNRVAPGDGTWNWRNTFRQGPWGLTHSPMTQRFARLDDMQAANVAVNQDAGITWAGSAYGGSGDYMRRWTCLALQALELPNPDPALATALHRLISEPGQSGDLGGMPNHFDANLAADPRALVTRVGTRRSFNVAPVVPAQAFALASGAAANTLVGLVTTTGGIPRATTANGTDAFEITAGDAGGLFSIDSAGALRRSASGSLGAGPYALTIRPQNAAGLGTAGTVTVTIT